MPSSPAHSSVRSDRSFPISISTCFLSSICSASTDCILSVLETFCDSFDLTSRFYNACTLNRRILLVLFQPFASFYGKFPHLPALFCFKYAKDDKSNIIHMLL